MRLPWQKPKVDIAETIRDVVSQELRVMWSTSPMPGAALPPLPETNTALTGKSPYPLYAYNSWQYFTPQAPTKRPDSPVSLQDLRNFADRYDTLRACIIHLKREVNVVPLRFVSKGKSDTKRQKAASDFFTRKGGLGGYDYSRSHFEGRVIEDLCVIGMAAIYYDYKRGGQFEALPIDASTIRPRVDAYGWPGPSEVQYEQWVMGLRVGDGFTRKEMYFEGLPTNVVTYSPYAKSPVEWLLYTIMRGLKTDEWNLSWLTDGTSSDQMFTLPEDVPPAEIEQFAAFHQAMKSGNSKQRQMAQWLPFGTTQIGMNAPRKDADFEQMMLDVARRCGAIMGVQLASIGFVGEQYKVSQEDAMGSTSEFGAGVLIEYLTELYTDILERLGYDDILPQFVTDKEENALDRAKRIQLLVGSGAKTPNEVRAMEGDEPIEGGDDMFISSNYQSLKNAAVSLQDAAGYTNSYNQVEQKAAQSKGTDNPDTKTDGKDAQRLALDQWERKCLNRLKAGKSAACGFESDDIPVATRMNIEDGIFRCATPESIRNLFFMAYETPLVDIVQRWRSGPRN